MHEPYDLIILGSGAGGGTLARRLAPTGKRILLIERGQRLPREQENWRASSVFVDKKYQCDETWFDKQDAPFTPGNHYWVGGNTKVYGGALFRLRERDFTEVQHAGGISPAWPISYGDLTPYYRQAEILYEVHGERGTDPLEPAESAPFPHPAVQHEPRIERLRQELLRAGTRPFPLPLALRLDERNRTTSPCIKCATCDGFPCLLHAKADAEIAGVDPALLSPNITLLTGAKVERLLTSASGREVTGVEVLVDGRIETLRGALVVVACGAINSAALLLRSANAQHPTGLANGSGLLGRNYMCHINSAMLALSLDTNPTVFQKTLGLNDYYYESMHSPFPMGMIQLLGKADGTILREHAPKLAPGFVLNAMAAHSIDFWLTTEDLPDLDNRVEIRSDGAIRLSYRPNNLAAHARLVATLKGLLGRIGPRTGLVPNGIRVSTRIPLAAVAHQVGTMRFGTDPAHSVLDLHCRTHDIANLYVVDGSFFPSISAVNPSLTIMANALRVGDHLAEQLE